MGGNARGVCSGVYALGFVLGGLFGGHVRAHASGVRSGGLLRGHALGARMLRALLGHFQIESSPLVFQKSPTIFCDCYTVVVLKARPLAGNSSGAEMLSRTGARLGYGRKYISYT